MRRRCGRAAAWLARARRRRPRSASRRRRVGRSTSSAKPAPAQAITVAALTAPGRRPAPRAPAAIAAPRAIPSVPFADGSRSASPSTACTTAARSGRVAGRGRERCERVQRVDDGRRAGRHRDDDPGDQDAPARRRRTRAAACGRDGRRAGRRPRSRPCRRRRARRAPPTSPRGRRRGRTPSRRASPRPPSRAATRASGSRGSAGTPARRAARGRRVATGATPVEQIAVDDHEDPDDQDHVADAHRGGERQPRQREDVAQEREVRAAAGEDGVVVDAVRVAVERPAGRDERAAVDRHQPAVRDDRERVRQEAQRRATPKPRMRRFARTNASSERVATRSARRARAPGWPSAERREGDDLDRERGVDEPREPERRAATSRRRSPPSAHVAATASRIGGRSVTPRPPAASGRARGQPEAADAREQGRRDRRARSGRRARRRPAATIASVCVPSVTVRDAPRCRPVAIRRRAPSTAASTALGAVEERHDGSSRTSAPRWSATTPPAQSTPNRTSSAETRSAIARALRQAVQGRAHRLGLPARPQPQRRGGRHAQRRRRQDGARRLRDEEQAAAAERGAGDQRAPGRLRADGARAGGRASAACGATAGRRALAAGPAAARCRRPRPDRGPATTARNARPSAGWNWVPRPASTRAAASSAERPGRYGRSDVIASHASARIRQCAESGISSAATW